MLFLKDWKSNYQPCERIDYKILRLLNDEKVISNVLEILARTEGELLKTNKIAETGCTIFQELEIQLSNVCETAYKLVTLSKTVLEILWRLALKFLKDWKSNTLSGDCLQKLETLKDWKDNQQCFKATGQEF